MRVFLPGLILALLVLGLWMDTYGWPRYREFLNREALRAKGYCPDCGLIESHCHCFRGDL